MNIEKATDKHRRFRERKHLSKYGPNVGDMRGKHGHNLKGKDHPAWNGGRWIHQDGYIAIKVPLGHHLRMANGYAYEHQSLRKRSYAES